jgi:phosphoglycolate phosphatase
VSGKRGIIFDMDNTLIQSNIDFARMKQEVYRYLTDYEVLPSNLDLHRQTTSTLIEMATETKGMTNERLQDVWDIAKRFEQHGMQNAMLEPGVMECLIELHRTYHIVVLTNNSVDAANTALAQNKIYQYFKMIVGREQVTSLKPAPDGFLYILECYPDITPQEWISVGDAWIDGKASAEAGVDFIAYRSDAGKMKQFGVFPKGVISHIGELIQYT